MEKLIPIREFLENGCWLDYTVVVPSWVEDDPVEIFKYIAEFKVGHIGFEIKNWDENGYYCPIHFTIEELKN